MASRRNPAMLSTQFIPRIDGRTRAARAIRSTVRALMAERSLSTFSYLEMAKIERAAQLLVLAESSRANALTQPADLDAIVRIENAAQRALRSLPAPHMRERPISITDHVTALMSRQRGPDVS